MNAPERMQISEFRNISPSFYLAVNSLDDESAGYTSSDNGISNISSVNSSSEVEGIVAGCFLRKADKLFSL